ncbi:siderophore-interacting protein [Propioniciclava soli]|uniref:Siderophore-interacting protein n=1 Tax=Propioniciclava soli TaxID=2775081 RepID=A0ABZ3C6Z1_9ACTN|nr:siderophore-interacting protein [Propioniciclava soli]
MNPYRTFATTLAGRERVSPSFVRITLAGADLGDCSPVLLDQRVKLLFGAPDVLAGLAGTDDWYPTWLAAPDADRPALRTYTLSAVRPTDDGAGEVDIDVAIHPLHGDEPAPGLRFALEAEPGTPCLLVAGDVTRPGHDTVGVAWQPGAAREVLLVGDETALPAVVNIAAALASDTTGRIVLEVPEADDVRAFPAPGGVRVEWRVRARGEQAVGLFGAPRTPSGAAVAALADAAATDPAADDPAADELLWDEAAADGVRYGWVAGEASWVRALRAEARAADVPKGQVAFMGYWKRGVAGS